MISVPYLKELFNYYPDTGTLIRLVATSNRVKVNEIAGYLSKAGYLQIRIGPKLYMAHQLIWLYMTTTWPSGEIDHINGNRADNRWQNLRVVTKAQNMQNRHAADRDSLTGVLGVCFDKQQQKYRAQLTMNGKKILNKLYPTLAEAKTAYNLTKENHYHF